MRHNTITEKVQTAINQGKIKPDQVQWASEYASRDPEGFEVFVSKAIAISKIPVIPAEPAIVDETQRQINKMCGVDDETYRQFGPDSVADKTAEKGADETQRLINSLFGVDDETYKKYGPGQGDPGPDPEIDETQRSINRLFGVDDATFKKYSNKR